MKAIFTETDNYLIKSVTISNGSLVSGFGKTWVVIPTDANECEIVITITKSAVSWGKWIYK